MVLHCQANLLRYQTESTLQLGPNRAVTSALACADVSQELHLPIQLAVAGGSCEHAANLKSYPKLEPGSAKSLRQEAAISPLDLNFDVLRCFGAPGGASAHVGLRGVWLTFSFTSGSHASSA